MVTITFPDRDTEKRALGFAFVFVVHLIVLIGTIRMCIIKGYRCAKLAAVISLIPVLSPGYLFGIPIGIWALVALRKPAVKKTFLANRTSPAGGN